jgi:hypothetical protein
MSVSIRGYDASTNLDLMKKLLLKLFMDTDHEALDDISKAGITGMTSSDYYERMARVAGLEQPAKITEDHPITIQDPKYGQTKDWEQEVYGGGFRVSYLFKKYNKWGLVEKFTKDLKKNQIILRNTEAFKLYNSANATTYHTGFDGLALAHDSHTLLDDAGTTYDNKTTSALSATTIEAAHIYMRKMKDDKGNFIPARANKLLIPPELEVTAAELYAPGGRPWEMSNTKNVLPTIMGVSIVSTPYLTDADNYFFLAEDDGYGPFIINGQDADLEVHNSYDDARATIVTSMQIFKPGFASGKRIYCGIV